MRSCSWSGCLTLILVMLSTVNTQQERTTPSFEAPVLRAQMTDLPCLFHRSKVSELLLNSDCNNL